MCRWLRECVCVCWSVLRGCFACWAQDKTGWIAAWSGEPQEFPQVCYKSFLTFHALAVQIRKPTETFNQGRVMVGLYWCHQETCWLQSFTAKYRQSSLNTQVFASWAMAVSDLCLQISRVKNAKVIDSFELISVFHISCWKRMMHFRSWRCILFSSRYLQKMWELLLLIALELDV